MFRLIELLYIDNTEYIVTYFDQNMTAYYVLLQIVLGEYTLSAFLGVVHVNNSYSIQVKLEKNIKWISNMN